VQQRSGLVRNLHRRGKKRRDRVRLALKVLASLLVLGAAAGLSAGVVHVVERPLPPFEVLADQLPDGVVDPTIPTDPLGRQPDLPE